MMNQYKPEGSLIRRHKNYEYTCSKEGLAHAAERGLILEGRVLLCDHNLNLHLSLGNGIKGIIPKDEVQFNYTCDPMKDIAILTRVGKCVCFKVLGLTKDQKGNDIAVLSRKEAQRECLDNYICGLIAGDIIPARITHLENFGAFVDVGCGITSLLSIDCISVSRISHPAERHSVGDLIYTVIKAIDEKGRLYVSQKELLGSWEENAMLFAEGQTVRGIIRSVENYGVFVELTPNLAGLAEYRPDVRSGQNAAVYIKSIIPDKMKIKLILIDAQDTQSLPTPIEYFIDPSAVNHIDSWRYSPIGSKRVIESIF